MPFPLALPAPEAGVLAHKKELVVPEGKDDVVIERTAGSYQ